jgi:hypothetical protein
VKYSLFRKRGDNEREMSVGIVSEQRLREGRERMKRSKWNREERLYALCWNYIVIRK